MSQVAAKVELPTKFANEVFVRLVVLLEEALKDPDSPAVNEQTLLCLETIANWLGFDSGSRANRLALIESKTETLHHFGLIKLVIKHLESPSLQTKQRVLHVLVYMRIKGHTAEEILGEQSLLSLILDLIRDKEYSLARNAAEFFRNISTHLKHDRLQDTAHVFQSLATLDQSDDIFTLNLESLRSLLCGESEALAADFMRRGLVTQYLNPMLQRQFNGLQEESLINLSAILRRLAESKLVQNQFSDQIDTQSLSEMIRLVDLSAVRQNLFAAFT